ncbi:MAG TPA: hypothetical protein VFJ13_09960 [Paracoccaceae bacterium]|nr:hypothetical protein [Paracoccaceae bacterium]
MSVTAGGSIAQDATGVSVAGVSRLTAAGDVTLDAAANRLDGRVDASGDDIALSDADAIQLGAVTAGGSLSVTATGEVTDTAGQQISVDGLASLDAGTAIDLDASAHDFATVDLTAGSVVIDEIDDIALGDITTDSLTLAAGGAITDTGTGSISVTGDTDLRAAAGDVFFDILLDGDDGDMTDLPHEFGGLLTATGGDIGIADNGPMLLGNIAANASGGGAGNLTLLAGGSITQADGTSVTAPGSSDIRANSGDIVLTHAGNDFADELNPAGSTVSLNGPGDVSVVDVDSIALGASSGSSLTLGATDMSAAGSLVFGDGISLTSAAGVVFGRALNDGDAGEFDVTDAEVARIQTTDLTITTAAGGIDVQGAALDTESLTLDSGTGSTEFTVGETRVAGALTVMAGGVIRQDAGGSVAVDGRTSLTAGGAIALGNAANNFDADAVTPDAVDEVDATGTNVALGDRDAIALGAITADSLTVNAGGSITDTPGKGITVTGATSMTALKGGDAFDIRLDGIDGDATDRPHDFSGTASFSARGEDVLVIDANAIRFGAVETGDNSAGTADPTLAGGGGDLTVDANGDITQAGAMVVRGEADFTSPGEVVLGANNDFRGAVNAVADTVLLSDRSAIALGAITADTLTVTADGTISDTAGRTITVAGDTSLTASDGAASFHDIRLDSGEHDFADSGAGFSAIGEDLSVTDIDAINLGPVHLHGHDGSADGAIAGNDGGLSVVAGGAITQSEAVRAPGETRLQAAGDILLGLQNRFGSSVDAAGGVVTLGAADSLRLGRIRAGGDLTVAAGGSITDTDGRSIEVTGRTSLAAVSGSNHFDILLDNEDAGAGDVHELGSRVDATGEDIRLSDISDLMLGTVTPHADATPDLTIDNGNNGDLTVRAGGTVTQHVALTIPGELDVTALDFVSGHYFDVVLSEDNDFGGAISAVGEDVSIRNTGGATTLGAIETHDQSGGTADTDNKGDLTVVSTAGSIIDTAGRAIVVEGQTSLQAVAGGNHFDVALDNADTHDFTGTVSATGQNIVLDDRTAILLGAVDANGGGDLTVRAGGTITQTGAGIEVEGRTQLEARDGGDRFGIDLDDADTNDFMGAVSATGADIVLDDRSAIQLGEVTATGNLSVTAAGSVTDTDGAAVTVGGATALLAEGFDIALDNADAHDFAGAVSATGGNITLNDRNAIRLGEVTATGKLDVTAAGSVTDTDGTAITVTGRATILAANADGSDYFDIEFDNPDHHDFNTVELTGEDIVLVDRGDLTIASAEGVTDASDDATVPGGGSIDLTVNRGDFRFAPGNAMPLKAGGDITLHARDGSFAVGADRRRLQDGLTFRSEAGDILLRLANGFVVEDIEGVGPFTLDAAAGRAHLVMGNEDRMEFYRIGTGPFLKEALSPDFNPQFIKARPGDPQLFHVTGDLVLEAAHPVFFRIQNTSLAPNSGTGTIVAGKTFLGGEFAALTMFGSFNGADGTTASIHGFEDLDGSFVVENANRANGCVILIPSSCQPIGSLSLSLDFPDGLLLGVKFLDPAEDLDDPFTNRGDEEEWE